PPHAGRGHAAAPYTPATPKVGAEMRPRRVKSGSAVPASWSWSPRPGLLVLASPSRGQGGAPSRARGQSLSRSQGGAGRGRGEVFLLEDSCGHGHESSSRKTSPRRAPAQIGRAA